MSNSNETAIPMPVTAIAPWFGSKRNLAPWIIEHIGEHRAYWEPFCGSLAVLLAKPHCTMETVNDLHGDLINLCRVLKDEDMAIDLYARISRCVFHESLFQEASKRCFSREGGCDDGPDVSRAEDYMIVSWFGRNGVAGTKSYNGHFCARFTSNGGHAAKRWRSVVDSIPAWHNRLRNVTILNRDAFSLLDRIEDREGTVIYCDPPYLVKGAKYLHDFGGDSPESTVAPQERLFAHHRRLAESLGRFKRTRVIVSYYADERLSELYRGWTQHTKEVTKPLSSNRSRVNEVLLVNMDKGGE